MLPTLADPEMEERGRMLPVLLAGQEEDWPTELAALTAKLKRINLPHQIAALKTFEDKVSLNLRPAGVQNLKHFRCKAFWKLKLLLFFTILRVEPRHIVLLCS